MQYRGGMAEFIRQAGRVQRKIEKRKEELKNETVEVTGGNGQLTVVANGGRELVRIAIDPALLKSEDLSMLQDLIVATSNAALAKVDELLETELKKITGGVAIPGLTS
jgi:DNA-binding YbaB/EbfC family protein